MLNFDSRLSVGQSACVVHFTSADYTTDGRSRNEPWTGHPHTGCALRVRRLCLRFLLSKHSPSRPCIRLV